jgi:hypothetical protein
VAHTYNPSFLGGRDQEDHSSKPAGLNNSSINTILKIQKKKDWQRGSSSKHLPSKVQTPVLQKKKRKNTITYIVIYIRSKEN